MDLKDDVPAEFAMMEGGSVVDATQQAWFQIQRWVDDALSRHGLTRLGLARAAYVSLQKIGLLLSSSPDQWPNPKYLQRIVAAIPEPPPPEVISAIRAVQGVPRSPHIELASTVDLFDRVDSLAAFGEWLTLAMAKARMTDVSLAEATGLPSRRIARWRRGDFALTDFPLPEELKSLSEACAAPVPTVDLWAEVVDPHLPVSVADEVAALALRLASVAYSAENVSRNAQVFIARFVSTEQSEATLQAIATPLGLTRERVRQIVDKMLAHRWLFRIRSDVAQSLLADLTNATPIAESFADSHFSPRLGVGIGTAAMLRYARDALGLSLSFEWQDRKGADRQLTLGGATDWWMQCRALARRMIRVRGAAHLPSVYVETIRQVEFPIDLSKFVATLEGADGFEWLEPGEWFWFGMDDGSNNPLEMVEAILRSAEHRLDIEVIHAGLTRARPRNAVSTTSSVAPPVHVLLALLQRCPRFLCVQGDDFELATDAPSTAPYEADTETSADAVVAYLETRSGLAAKIELTEDLVDTGAMNAVTLSVALASSPLISRVQLGIYAIRGRSLDPERFAEAVAKVGGEGKTTKSLVVNRDTGQMSWRVPVTVAMLGRSVIYFPAGSAEHVVPGPYTGPRGYSVDVTPLRIAGVARLLRLLSVQPEDILEVHVDVPRRTVDLRVVTLPSSTGAAS